MYEKGVICLLQPQEQVAWAEGKRSTFLINKPSLLRQEFPHEMFCKLLSLKGILVIGK